jgi:hypothetical protein
MRRIIDVLSILGLVVAPVSVGLAYTNTHTPQSIVSSKVNSQKFPLNQPKLVEFQTDLAGFKQFTDRQKNDQIRDWLLLTVLSNQGLSAEEINQATYDLPTVRYDFMQPVSNFEYGETRSLYIGKGRVIALVPKSSSQVERKDDLAHIADRHRKDLGEKPTSLIIFEYEINPDKQFALLTQKGALDTQKLFSSEYGYYEASVKSLQDLQRFMRQVNDITSCTIQDNSLLMSGRKINAHEYQGVKVEDIAAIFQSEAKIETEKMALEGSGFSLDPKYDYKSLKEKVKIAKPFLLNLQAWGNLTSVSEEEIQTIEQAISQENVIPYLKLLDRLRKGPQLQIGGVGGAEAVTDFLRARESTSYQTARYDGDLQGTEVGMVLFYTDLLAKLWAFNYVDSAPSQVIQNFTPFTKVKISSIYKKEIEAFPSTRIWFGPRDHGFQIVNESNSLLFSRNATRIYAASSNPLNPGKETTAAANTDSFINWWNDHYEEVAHYEKQYEKLNQIMKWSLVISWLNKSNHSESLSFLRTISVKHTNWFPDWVKEQGDRLKFQNWQQVGFFEVNHKGSKTESMPLLKSKPFQIFEQTRLFSGGVSLGNKSKFEGRKALNLSGDLVDLSRRSNLKYNSISNGLDKISFKTLDETTYSLRKLSKNLSRTTAKAKAEVKFRNLDLELNNQAFSRNISQTKSGLKVETSIGNTEFGTFSTAETKNGFQVGFLSRDMDEGYSLAHRLSVDPRAIEVVLKENADIESILKSSTSSDYVVKLSSSNRWLKITEEDLNVNLGGGGFLPPEPPDNWQMLVGDLGDNPRHLRLTWLDDKTVKKQLQGKELESIYNATVDDTTKDIFGFTQDWENFKYKDIAQKLPDNRLAFLISNKKYLKINLKNVDRLLKAQNDAKAAKIITKLIEQYGPVPDLILRQAIIKVRKGILKIEQVFPKEVAGKSNFLNEINGLLGSKNFRLSRIETEKAFIYVQNHPGLNNLDWNIPFDKSVPSSSGARVYQVMPGELGGIKLHLSGLNDSSASFHASTKFQDANGTYTNSIPNSLKSLSRFKANNNDCSTDNDDNINIETKCLPENQDSNKPTYFVIVPNNS